VDVDSCVKRLAMEILAQDKIIRDEGRADMFDAETPVGLLIRECFSTGLGRDAVLFHKYAKWLIYGRN